MRKRLGYLLFVFLLLCTGCGKKTENENIALGMEAIKALDNEGALAYFEKALVNGEDQQLIYRGQGMAQIGLVEYEEAAKSLEKALSCTTTVSDLEFDINYYLATAYYKSGEIDKALKTYDSILAMKPKEKQAHYLRGVLLLKKNSYEKAKEDFDKAIEIDPADYGLLIDIYKSLADAGYEDLGTEYLNKVMETNNKSLTDYDRGRISYYMKDYENARNYLEKARETGGIEVILSLGKTYEALGDMNYASGVYSTYLEKDQSSPEIYNQLGLCKLSLSEYEEALSAFQAGMLIEGNDYLQNMKFNEIVAYEFLGQFKKATVLMEAYLKTYPGDEEAKREYEFLKTR